MKKLKLIILLLISFGQKDKKTLKTRFPTDMKVKGLIHYQNKKTIIFEIKCLLKKTFSCN